MEFISFSVPLTYEEKVALQPNPNCDFCQGRPEQLFNGVVDDHAPVACPKCGCWNDPHAKAQQILRQAEIFLRGTPWEIQEDSESLFDEDGYVELVAQAKIDQAFFDGESEADQQQQAYNYLADLLENALGGYLHIGLIYLDEEQA